jgi:hypothetical protein
MQGDITFNILLNPPQFYPIPNEKEAVDGCKSRPKIEAHVIQLNTFRLPSIVIDNGTGSLGFLTDQKSFLRFEDL